MEYVHLSSHPTPQTRRVLSLNLTEKWIPTRSIQSYSTSALLNLKPLNSRISDCMRNGFTEEAQMLFDEMPQRNTVTYNAMIRGYSKMAISVKGCGFMELGDCGLVGVGKVDLAEEFFKEMGTRDIASWTTMISGLASAGRIVEARGLFEDMP
ncbi:Pentatricopeptide repeat-containing protein, mitochondrial [Vitis vinifera]|uniref:Pentatricopeptide repeat-containing protein, mitochondrial n=1 Tax=Vitis vinifera TaxID=29760 RepID=A0A438HZY6_VITVI|nr:Pentatricopeptide repeat-containing protein, mitochondrial [Vitis vinifera]